MHWQRPSWSRWAAWLGVIALSLNALVPIHLAFDLAEALEPATHIPAATAGGDLQRRLLARVCGHQNGENKQHGKHHETNCPVCAAVGTLIAFAAPANPVLPVPVAIAIRLDADEFAAEPQSVSAAFYRSRAPPLA
jgi:Protein of unknown function (DUF2946)